MSQKKKTVLLVEDEDSVGLVLKMVLEHNGYAVHLAETGHEALKILGNGERIDLMLIDLVLPGDMSGQELAEKVQRSRPEIKIIYSTGYGREKIGDEVPLEDGVNFIQKPYEAAALLKIIRKAFGDA
jgi:DNA-binding NtrC family response regulator